MLMKIKRLEFGICKLNGERIAWDEPLFSAARFCCGCYNVGIWIWYFTWLSDECFFKCADPECDCQDD